MRRKPDNGKGILMPGDLPSAPSRQLHGRSGITLNLFMTAIIMLTVRLHHCGAQDRMNAPVPPSSHERAERYGAGNNAIINFYQKWISPVKGGNTCPMHPSCSQYAKQAFEALPWYDAYLRSLERLLRCGNDLQFYSRIVIDNNVRWKDPLPHKETPYEVRPADEILPPRSPARR